MSGASGPRLPTHCPVCKGAVIQRVSGGAHAGVVWFQCFFCNHMWRFRLDARADPDGELTGEVFVVAADGTRHALGSAVLHAIPEQMLTEHLERKTVQSEREHGKLQREIDAVAAILKEEKAEEERLWHIQKSDENDMQKANAWSLVYNKTKDLSTKLDNLHAQQRHLTSGDYFFQDMPSSISTVRTDADGKFTLLIPRDGRYGIAARGFREAGEQRETYCWFVWVSLGGEHSKHLVLNNDNMVGAGSADSALR